MPVTADSTLWTADTVCVTADGRIICIDADVVEPIHGWVTADTTTFYTADNTTWPTADGGVLPGASDSFDAVRVVGGAVISEAAAAVDQPDAVTGVAAAVVEAATALDATDAAIGAQVLFGTVDEPATALDQLDADVVSVEVPIAPAGGRAHRRRPLPVYGIGYGVLPQLWGEAHGVVGVAGKSAAQLVVRAAAVGACGQAGTAAVVLKSLAVAAKGAVGARGTGSGMIVKFSGSATGHHDDDEAAVIAFLLAA